MLRWSAVVVLGLCACKEKDPVEEDRVDIVLGLDGDVAVGQDFYANNCVVCHAADGTGGTGPDLNVSLADNEKADMVRVIIEGKDVMPAWGMNEDDQTVADIVAYIYDAFGP